MIEVLFYSICPIVFTDLLLSGIFDCLLLLWCLTLFMIHIYSLYAMDFDLNEDLGSDISVASVLQVDQVVEDRVVREWDLNVQPEILNAEVEPEVREGSGESEIHQFDLNVEPEPNVILDTVRQRSGELEVAENQIVSAPVVGDDFDSVEEAHDFWKLYGFQTGFGVCKRTFHKKGGNVVDFRFECTKFREKREKVEEGEPFPERRRPSGNSNCKVFLKIKYSQLTGSWRVDKLFLEHNHELTPGSSFLIPGYRYIPKRFKDMLEFNSDQGLSPANNIELVLKMAGGYFKGTFTRKDARNHIDNYKRGKLRALGGHDANLLADYFEKKQLYDSNFWYTYKHTNDAHLWNIFWADGRGRAAYKYYHDVVVMDATYLTNR